MPAIGFTPTIVRADGTTTCCGAYSTIYVDDGVEYCKACYQPVLETLTIHDDDPYPRKDA